METPFDNNKCNDKIFTYGVSIGLYDIPKETANSICKGIQALTGIEIDWHYVAGYIKLWQNYRDYLALNVKL